MNKILPIFYDGCVSVYHWAPPAKHNYKNFGDEIGPLIVQRLLQLSGVTGFGVVGAEKDRNKVIAVGSVVHQAIDGDVLWGSGVNGKSWPRNLEKIKKLHVGSVRGPLTRNVLLSYGHECPERYGDPGLIFPELFQAEIAEKASELRETDMSDILFIPNLNDDRFLDMSYEKSLTGVKYVSPNLSPYEMAAVISKAKLVISSSLHGIVFSDAYKVPVIPVLSYFEPIFKYIDYFEGTGRAEVKFAASLNDAMDYPEVLPAEYSSHSIRSAFPVDVLGITR